MQQPVKKYDMDVPVYHGKFKDALEEIKKVLKGYQHDLTVTQRDRNGATTSLEVTITLKN